MTFLGKSYTVNGIKLEYTLLFPLVMRGPMKKRFLTMRWFQEIIRFLMT